MKKQVISLIALFLIGNVFAQRQLNWSVGDVRISCEDSPRLSFPLMVSIDDASDNPVLATSTIRFFYDAESMGTLIVENVMNEYQISGLRTSNPVFGEAFGFTGKAGVFVQFNLMDNAALNPILLSEQSTHVLDLTFEVPDTADYPLCTSIVFDSNRDGQGNGVVKDGGFLPNDAGMVGTYFLNNNLTDAIQADDEVEHFNWRNANSFRGKIELGKRPAGIGLTKNCLREVCDLFNDCDFDGVPDSQEIDRNNNGVPDDCENGKPDNPGSWMRDGNRVDMYPVPFDDEVFVRYTFEYDTYVIVLIYDTKGILVKENYERSYKKGQEVIHRLDMKNASNQFYFVRIVTNQETITKNIVSSSLKRKN